MIKRLVKQPFGLLLARAFVSSFGNARLQEQYGVLQRASYAYGMFRAADLAKHYGKRSTTVCEFGVAAGNGLLNMITLAEKIQHETGVAFRIVGFDTGEGLPEIEGYKDHPELWSIGDFSMQDKDKLTKRIGGRAELIFGDIKVTLPGFMKTLDSASPLAFISIDVDIYSAATSALHCLQGKPELYNPAVSIYLDDVAFFFANRWCGELAAVEEFNATNQLRKIDIDRSLPGERPDRQAPFYKHMYACHIFDHESRVGAMNRKSMTLEEHKLLMDSKYLV